MKLLNKIRNRDISFLTRQLAILQSAGVPLLQSLVILMENERKPNLKNLIMSLKRDIEKGFSFNSALRKHPRYFDEFYCSLIETSELSGALDIILERLATHLERKEALKQKIKKSLYYPAAVFCVGLTTTLLLLTYVLPIFKELFQDMGNELPSATRCLISLSDFLRTHGKNFLILICSIFMMIYFLFFRIIKLKLKEKQKEKIKIFLEIKKRIDAYCFTIPVFGKLFQKTYLVHFAETLALTIDAGVPLIKALETLLEQRSNLCYRQAILELKQAVLRGQSLNQSMKIMQPMKGYAIFTDIFIQLVKVGEETGKLSESLNKIGSIYDQEVQTALLGLTTLIEPIMMVLLGLLTGGVVISLYLPIFQMGSLF